MKIFISFLAIFTFSTHAGELLLEVGKSRTLPLPMDAHIQVGSRSLLRAVDREDHVVLIGLKPGRTFVAINGKTTPIQVLPSGQGAFTDVLRQHLKNRKGLDVHLKSGEVHVDGELYVFKDWLELVHLAKNLNATYSFDARPTAEALREAERYFQNQIQTLDLPPFRMLDARPIRVSIKDKPQADFLRAKDFFESFGLKVEASSSPLEVRPLIKTSVILAEVSRHASSSVGFEFPTEISGQLAPKIKGPESLMVSLKALESKGLGKVLASPTLNTRSGTEAEFHAGGEFPVKLTGFRRQNVEWKKHGVVLKVRPQADPLGTIQLEIETEISLLDATRLVDGIPAVKVNRAKSAFDLKNSATVVLSGLLQETWGKSRDGVFGLAQIPLLGALFRSEEFLSHRSELMIFVTPEIVTNASTKLTWPADWGKDEL